MCGGNAASQTKQNILSSLKDLYTCDKWPLCVEGELSIGWKHWAAKSARLCWLTIVGSHTRGVQDSLELNTPSEEKKFVLRAQHFLNRVKVGCCFACGINNTCVQTTTTKGLCREQNAYAKTGISASSLIQFIGSLNTGCLFVTSTHMKCSKGPGSQGWSSCLFKVFQFRLLLLGSAAHSLAEHSSSPHPGLASLSCLCSYYSLCLRSFSQRAQVGWPLFGGSSTTPKRRVLLPLRWVGFWRFLHPGCSPGPDIPQGPGLNSSLWSSLKVEMLADNALVCSL